MVFLFIGLFAIAKPSQAFIGTGLFDYAMSAMGGLADMGGWAFAIFFSLFLGVGISTLLVGTSAHLLEWSMSLQVNLGNSLVTSGWQFILGLANLFFILIFIYIALSFILRLDTLRMKKALPNLIIIALLINFSLLLVGVFVDVATFFQNTILDVMTEEGKGLTSTTIEALTGGANRLTTYLAITLGASMVGLAIPFADIVTMIATIGLSLAFLPNIVTGFFITFFNIIVALIFLFYTVLFMARVIVIWLLAIFAPLAFMSYILPGTRKFFDQWIHALLSWSFLGIIALFLLMLGLKLIGGTMSGLTAIGGHEDLPQYIIFYTFFTIYFVISLIISKKLAPMGTEVVWKYGGMAINKGGAWGAQRFKRLTTKAMMRSQQMEARIREKEEKKIALTRREKMAKWPAKWTVRRIGGAELAEPKAMAARRRLVHEERSKLSASIKDMDDKGKQAFLQAEIARHKKRPEKLRNKEKTAALQELLVETKAPMENSRSLFDEASKAGGKPTRDKVLERSLHWGTDSEIDKRINTMNPADIDKLSKEARNNTDVIKKMVETMRIDFVTRLGSQSLEVRKKIQDHIDKTLGEKWRRGGKFEGERGRKELRFLLGIHNSPTASSQNWPTYGTPTEIKKKLKTFRGKTAPKRIRRRKTPPTPPPPATERPSYPSI
ncbi:hypothetical protein ES703_50112 [subsurface metagenome]